MNTKDQLIFFEIFSGGVAMLFFDFKTIAWTAMFAAMRNRKHHRAVLNTLLRTMLAPWLIIFLIIMTGPSISAIGVGFIMGVWFMIGIIIDAILVNRSRFLLTRYFRLLASAETIRLRTDAPFARV